MFGTGIEVPALVEASEPVLGRVFWEFEELLRFVRLFGLQMRVFGRVRDLNAVRPALLRRARDMLSNPDSVHFLRVSSCLYYNRLSKTTLCIQNTKDKIVK